MAYITTDTDVACTLTVSKTENGENIPGYPKDYSILGAFGEYPGIEVLAWRIMERNARDERIIAFKEYVNRIELIDVDDTSINDVYRHSAETPGMIV
ncbi:hypothetical protein [Butyricimonas paravirosa]|uniref:hypothetical protein n=1 Tax=Butyricimonas paravirosa TaxID=1472417 RepID=UPI0022E0A052|nr:hypothetical protein [Butyricimonas paravirosa]